MISFVVSIPSYEWLSFVNFEIFYFFLNLNVGLINGACSFLTNSTSVIWLEAFFFKLIVINYLEQLIVCVFFIMLGI